jgi:2-polyprenyl-3-methyl-5-hydroxy-6-metoxy-1,4-benzoquinol methylase
MIELFEKQFSTLENEDVLELEIKNPNYKNLVDLAQINLCEFSVAKILDDNTILARFTKIKENKSFHLEEDSKEKYGTNSTFGQICKNDHVAFLHFYKQALKNVNVDSRKNILNLGVNNADEFEVIKELSSNFSDLQLLGIDYCPSAIKKAKEKFQEENVNFQEADINTLKLKKEYDLIISIGTLQSSNLEFKPLFQKIVQEYLKKDGSMILGFPNCRWYDNNMVYGAMVKNYNFPESSVLINDVFWCKKYLQQKKFRVTITGKDYIFLTATSIRK